MNFLTQCVNDLNIQGTYYTPNKIIIKLLFINPPFKTL